MGILPYGYLGVDVFLVINGYFITKELIQSFQNDTFSYWDFLINKLTRLWPLVVIACTVSLCIGWYYMLPDDYENLAESVVASSTFSQNILGSFLSEGYWAVINEYRPLMHFWFVSILMQCYVIYPILLISGYKLIKLYNQKSSDSNNYRIVLGILFALSFLLYLLPRFNIPSTIGFIIQSKFYFIQYRLFEIVMGGLISLNLLNQPNKTITFFQKIIFVLCWFAIILMNVINTKIADNTIKVIITSCITVLFIYLAEIQFNTEKKSNLLYKILANCGVASYSVFVWHQGILAWYRYIINGNQFNTIEYIELLLAVIIVSIFSYQFLEKPLQKFKSKSSKRIISTCTLVVSVVICTYSLYLYSIAGVIRDVPELGFKKGEGSIGLNIAYCDRVYKMDKDFVSTGKKKVLVIGDSFGRDMVNVLLESEYADSLEISYIYFANLNQKNAKNYIPRIIESDYIMIRGIMPNGIIKVYKDEIKKKVNIYGIGTKRFGVCNGNIYSKRNSSNYFSSRQSIPEKELKLYNWEKAIWGEKYIDFITPLVDENNTMPVFSDTKRFISSDCKHLTKDGAIYYAKKLNLGKILGFE